MDQNWCLLNASLSSTTSAWNPMWQDDTASLDGHSFPLDENGNRSPRPHRMNRLHRHPSQTGHLLTLQLLHHLWSGESQMQIAGKIRMGEMQLSLQHLCSNPRKVPECNMGIHWTLAIACFELKNRQDEVASRSTGDVWIWGKGMHIILNPVSRF